MLENKWVVREIKMGLKQWLQVFNKQPVQKLERIH
jgi:hypothetical protein